MNELEATKVAKIVGELWPTPPMTDMREAFYATAISDIPTFDQAVEGVNALFVTERFQPTPGEVIDAALNLGSRAVEAWEALRTAASLHAQRLPVGEVPRAASAALRASGWALRDMPVDNLWQMEKIRQAFHRTYIAQERSRAAHAVEAPRAVAELDRVNPDTVTTFDGLGRPIDTTTAARRL